MNKKHAQNIIQPSEISPSPQDNTFDLTNIIKILENHAELLMQTMTLHTSELMSRQKEWISVDEKLPPNGTYVLVALYDYREKVQMHFIQIAERINEDWFDGHNGDSIIKKESRVTHWMPLPDEPSYRMEGIINNDKCVKILMATVK